VEVREDDLHFDYKLREGIGQKMNARFLPERMGRSKANAQAKA